MNDMYKDMLTSFRCRHAVKINEHSRGIPSKKHCNIMYSYSEVLNIEITQNRCTSSIQLYCTPPSLFPFHGEKWNRTIQLYSITSIIQKFGIRLTSFVFFVQVNKGSSEFYDKLYACIQHNQNMEKPVALPPNKPHNLFIFTTYDIEFVRHLSDQ